MTGLYAALGLAPAEARQRALLAVAVYLGHAQLEQSAPGILPADDLVWRDHLRLLEQALGLGRTSGGTGQ